MARRTRAERRKRARRVFKNIFWVLGNIITLGQMVRNKRSK